MAQWLIVIIIALIVMIATLFAVGRFTNNPVIQYLLGKLGHCGCGISGCDGECKVSCTSCGVKSAFGGKCTNQLTYENELERKERETNLKKIWSANEIPEQELETSAIIASRSKPLSGDAYTEFIKKENVNPATVVNHMKFTKDRSGYAKQPAYPTSKLEYDYISFTGFSSFSRAREYGDARQLTGLYSDQYNTPLKFKLAM
jgi:hypothetical protein